MVGHEYPVVMALFYPQEHADSDFSSYMGKVVEACEPHVRVGILPVTEGNQLAMSEQDWTTKMSANTLAFQMFSQLRYCNIIDLAFPNEAPVEAARPQALLDRLIRRLKPFEPARTTVVRRPKDNAGHVQLGSATTAALFPSRAMRDQAVALREAGRLVNPTTRVASHAQQM